LASIPVTLVHTKSAVLTGIGIAFIDRLLTSVTREAAFAVARVGASAINATTAVLAWLHDRETVIQIHLTARPEEARTASARVAVSFISACAAILAWCRQAVVNLGLALLSYEAGRTCAPIAIDKVLTDPAMEAGAKHLALVNLLVAQCPRVARRADALERIGPIAALGAVAARVGGAVVKVGFAVEAIEPGLAVAEIAVAAKLALGAIFTRARLAGLLALPQRCCHVIDGGCGFAGGCGGGNVSDNTNTVRFAHRGRARLLAHTLVQHARSTAGADGPGNGEATAGALPVGAGARPPLFICALEASEGGTAFAAVFTGAVRDKVHFGRAGGNAGPLM